MKRGVWSLVTGLFWALASVNPALAFQLSPISQVFAPIGNDATQSYEITNDGDHRIAVEVSVVERDVDLDGHESYEPADDDFLIYPPQMILEPGAVQTVRVTWLGDPAPSQELAYRLIAEQLPITLLEPDANIESPTGSVQILLRYLGSLYIRPAGVTANIQLTAVENITSDTGEEQVAITLVNQGTASARLRNLQVRLTAAGTEVTLQGEQLEGMVDQVVLAGDERRFVLSRPVTLPGGPVAASFEYNQGE